jgi:hypothetical protein
VTRAQRIALACAGHLRRETHGVAIVRRGELIDTAYNKAGIIKSERGIPCS